MSTRCPDCNKWASLEMQDPEVQSLEVGNAGVVSAEVRIVRNCADCSTEMKEAMLSMEVEDCTPDGCKCKEPELSIEEDSVEAVEEGGGRYAKSYFGARVEATVTCDKCKKTRSVELTDKVPASGMDELN